MGITIYSTNVSNDLGAFGFQNLRRTVSKLVPCKEIKEHYEYLLDHLDDIFLHKEKAREYDKKLGDLFEKHGKKYRKVMNFLWASDVEAEFGYGTAKKLLEIIGDYDDKTVYGYAGWGDKAMKFKDFKAILKDAAESKRNWGWR